MHRLLPIAFALLTPVTATALDYDGAFAEARRLESLGQFADAAAQLEPLAEAYPQDYGVFLQLGWLLFQAHQYEAAETAYRTAHKVSQGSIESTLGLGWTLLRQQRTDEARQMFVAVQILAPDDPSAAEGLAAIGQVEAARPSWHSGFYAGAVGELYVDPATATMSAGLGGEASLGLRFGATTGTVSYSFVQYATTEDSPGAGPANGRRRLVADAGFHEVHASLGWAPREWGMSLHYGGVFSDSFVSGNAFGGVLRLSLLGDMRLEGSFASFDDEVQIGRVAPSWTIPLDSVLFVTPSGAFQTAEGRTFWAGGLELGVQTKPLTVAVGGSYGQAYRPVLWTVPSIETTDGIQRLRASATVDIPLGGAWGLYAGYAFSQFDPLARTTDRFVGHGAAIGIHRSMW